MVTSATGFWRWISSTVSATRRKIRRAAGSTSSTPITASSDSATRLTRPSAAMVSPPMPAKRTRPPMPLFQRLHQPPAQEIARGLAGDDVDQRRCIAHDAITSVPPTGESP